MSQRVWNADTLKVGDLIAIEGRQYNRHIGIIYRHLYQVTSILKTQARLDILPPSGPSLETRFSTPPPRVNIRLDTGRVARAMNTWGQRVMESEVEAIQAENRRFIQQEQQSAAEAKEARLQKALVAKQTLNELKGTCGELPGGFKYLELKLWPEPVVLIWSVRRGRVPSVVMLQGVQTTTMYPFSDVGEEEAILEAIQGLVL